MFRKINATYLIIGIAALVIIIFIVESRDTKTERTIRETLISVDTSQISVLEIYSKNEKNQHLKLLKEGNNWKVKLENKSFAADNLMISNLLALLKNLKPQRLAANDREKFAEFQVNDTSAVQVNLQNNGKNLAKLYVGKFSFNQQTRQMTSFVRLSDETEIYAVDGFLRMSFNSDPLTYRNKIIARIPPENITKLTFSYPADSSFTLIKQMEKWKMKGIEVPNDEINRYLEKISHFESRDFFEKENLSLKEFLFSLQIEGNNFLPVQIKVFKYENNFILTSSQNLDSYFEASKSNLMSEIFISSKKWTR